MSSHERLQVRLAVFYGVLRSITEDLTLYTRPPPGYHTGDRKKRKKTTSDLSPGMRRIPDPLGYYTGPLVPPGVIFSTVPRSPLAGGAGSVRERRNAHTRGVQPQGYDATISGKGGDNTQHASVSAAKTAAGGLRARSRLFLVCAYRRRGVRGRNCRCAKQRAAS